MTKRQELYEQAGREVLEVIEDDGRWELFVQQVGQHWELDSFVSDVRRESAKQGEPNSIAMLQAAYFQASMKNICDSVCRYCVGENGKQAWRRGVRVFARRRKWDCVAGESAVHGTTPPEGLDEERNLCGKYYWDCTQ